MPAQRVAVVGCGYWGRNIIRNLYELGALAAVADIEPDRAATAAKAHGVACLDLEQILAERTIAAVAIATPAVSHASVIRAALSAGKHVFAEKPLALEVGDAEELCALARSTGRVLMVGHLLRYHPAFRKLKELVDDGALGRLQLITSNRLGLGKVRREENVLWSLAPHDISMILALTGAEPETVIATGAPVLHRSIIDMAGVHLAFASGVTAQVNVSWLHPVKEQRLCVVGDQGMAVFDDSQPWPAKLQLYPHRMVWKAGVPTPVKADAVPVALDQTEPLKSECAHFLECLDTRRQPVTDGAEGLRVLKVLAAAQRSLDERRTVEPGRGPPAPRCFDPKRFDDVTIHESAYVDEPAEIGPGSRIWHFSHILGHVRIGHDCVVGQNVVIGPHVNIGDRCKIQNNVSIYRGVTLEDGVFCGPSCVFTNVNNPRAEIGRMDELRPTLVRRGASIGANATIVCGVTLGEYCFIGAGAVIVRDVPAYALMAGVPARRIGWMSRAGLRLGDDLICPAEGLRYRQVGDDRLEEIPASW